MNLTSDTGSKSQDVELYLIKKQSVISGCDQLKESISKQVKIIYARIWKDAQNQLPETRNSYLLSQEHIQVSGLISQQLQIARSIFMTALEEAASQDGEPLYSSAQVTLMWQAVLGRISPPSLDFPPMRSLHKCLSEELEGSETQVKGRSQQELPRRGKKGRMDGRKESRLGALFGKVGGKKIISSNQKDFSSKPSSGSFSESKENQEQKKEWEARQAEIIKNFNNWVDDIGKILCETEPIF